MRPRRKPWRAEYGQAEDNPVMTRALGGDVDRPVPTLLELLRPSFKLVLRPSAVRPSGWNFYHTKLVPDR